ncbi:TPA: hypothetical protein KDZ08_004814 [Vibrio parahaemolyticus]|uniref:hypothetical protein n=1 Tax=Vibrio TaxID=662 RepID=UPI001B841F73|nr:MULTISPECIES: hypothetical protein [Vibrio]BDP38555.1 hypothetical protein VA208B3_49260 [Vibrio alginolyticus]MCR9820093.1 hypothetical protein [Vibrio parahaemolyticus]BDP33556.1 hypothetical protein VV208B2_46360 [Vibrio vulnificus]HBC3540200.1 hypothetical protein [Vibrio parahaemolyticus]HBC3592913.1 hypothetical protein [Vibrio parahaemolyticus]
MEKNIEFLPVGENVIWYGRKHGSCTHDHLFIEDAVYMNTGCHPNGDIELQLSDDKPEISIRATQDEYGLLSEYEEQREQSIAEYGVMLK